MNNTLRFDKVLIKLVVFFALTTGLWFYAADLLEMYVINDLNLIKQLSFYKVLLFVIISSSQLYFLLCRYTSRIQQGTAKLRESEQRYATLMENARDGIFIQTNGRFAYLNSSACRIFGVQSAEELIGTKVVERYHPACRHTVLERIRTINEEHQPVSSTDDKCLRMDGTPFDVDVQALPFEHNGEMGALVFFSDISRHRQALTELEQGREFLATILDSIEDGVVVCNQNGETTLFNRAARWIHGIPEVSLPPERWVEYYDICESDGGTRIKLDDSPLCKALHGIDVNNQEIVIKPKDALPVILLATGRQLVDSCGNKLGAVVTLHDITIIKNFEEHLRHSQKMDSIGTLAGGVAHDFNNIITVIMGACTLLMMKMKSDPGIEPFVKQILDSSERAAKLTHSLLAFSRKQNIRLHSEDMNSIVMTIHELLDRIIGEDIKLETDISPIPLPVSVDRGQIEQVLMNLAANARDAMLHGGLLRIETSLVDSTRIHTVFEGCKSGMYAQIVVSDNGTGMDKATQSRVFDPFFTTKDAGRGTGLGLSMAYGIIRQHDGGISVSSAPGIGTIVFIHLPIRHSCPDKIVLDKELSFAMGNETILLVEDDKEVREINGNILAKVGYTVLTASNGYEALQLFEKHLDTISLVVLDVIMPGMNGKELHDNIKNIRPDAKVLFASGYSAEHLHKKGLIKEEVNLLPKPFSPQVLLGRVRDVIDHSLA
ncbi:MAG: hypothetical protein A2X83_06890 [Desulfuromonadales bacterium GWD2_54_10]|nr:MAG: hypothetical protein A2X83_06890 [Desulfuromonadales bacterium GWD2_54_10]